MRNGLRFALLKSSRAVSSACTLSAMSLCHTTITALVLSRANVHAVLARVRSVHPTPTRMYTRGGRVSIHCQVQHTSLAFPILCGIKSQGRYGEQGSRLALLRSMQGTTINLIIMLYFCRVVVPYSPLYLGSLFVQYSLQ